MRTNRCLLSFGVILSLALSATAQRDTEIEVNKRCLECHGREHIAELGPEERLSMVGTRLSPEESLVSSSVGVRDAAPPVDAPETRPGLYVTPDLLAGGVHAEISCVECHEDARLLPHPARLELRVCARTCHSDEGREYDAGSHGRALKEGQTGAPGCVTCHGGHRIVRVAERGSRVHRLKSIFLCGDCHQGHEMETPGGFNESEHVPDYMASAHGRAFSKSGLIAAAGCVDCHASHGVQPASDPRSLIHRERVPTTCGKCHLGIIEVYAKSIHGRRLAEGDPGAPVCTDCHTAHRITRATTLDFMLDIVNECGHCHDDSDWGGDQYGTYRASYHGQVSQLGSARAARCSSCHGAHNILPSDDPASLIHESNLIQTCGQASCHPRANSNFVLFDPHADFRNADRYPLLHGVWIYFVVVMSTVFGFFGIHTLLWFFRSVIERWKRGPMKVHNHESSIRRFSILNRINHALVAITFLGLTTTGIPLVFSGEPWAAWMAVGLGGIEMAGVWHRMFGFMLVLNILAHLVGVIRSFRLRRGTMREWVFGPDSLVPSWRDVTDCLAMFRWFLRGGPKPRFDRWTYYEKFDYWCEIGGSAIIGTSGFLLWFPMLSSQVLPGWAFNVAMIVHGYEALLALGFIFTIHFFNANLRIDKFPVDEVIFSGRVPEEELADERPDEYARLVETGVIEELRLHPWETWKVRLFKVLGIGAMALAITLLILIITASLNSL